MTALELKNDLLKMVADTDDVDLLTQVQAFFSSLRKKTDWWDELSEQQKNMIETGRQQLESGQGISHEEVKAKVREMLSKN